MSIMKIEGSLKTNEIIADALQTMIWTTSSTLCTDNEIEDTYMYFIDEEHNGLRFRRHSQERMYPRILWGRIQIVTQTPAKPLSNTMQKV